MQADNSFADTDAMLARAERHRWIAAVTGWVPLLDPSECERALARYCAHPLFRGVRHLVHDEPDPDWLLRPAVHESLALLAERGVVFEIPAVFPRHLVHIPRLARRFPELKIVIDHLGKPPIGDPGYAWDEQIAACAEHPNVYAKLSGLNTVAPRGALDGRASAPILRDCSVRPWSRTADVRLGLARLPDERRLREGVEGDAPAGGDASAGRAGSAARRDRRGGVRAVSVVLVTGAAAGIGAACVEAFAGAGWDVVAVDREPLADGMAGDVTRPEVNVGAVGRAIERYGRLDAVVANAGASLALSIDDTTDEDIDRLFAVNVRAVIYLAQAAHAALADSRGSFVVMASKTGLVAQPDSPLYCATKGAAVQLARALALDWAPEGIRVNAVCPGIVDTPMLEGFFDELPEPDRARREFATAQPLGRLARPAECAAAALFLASPSASFITGVALPVDGGFTAQ